MRNLTGSYRDHPGAQDIRPTSGAGPRYYGRSDSALQTRLNGGGWGHSPHMEAHALPRTGRLFLPRSKKLLATLSDERLVEQVRRGNEAVRLDEDSGSDPREHRPLRAGDARGARGG